MFNNYFKFCIEREPVEKCISDYFMLKNSPYHNKNRSKIEWKEYLLSGKLPLDTNKYVDENLNLSVDKILKYENLNQELQDISLNLGFNFIGLNVRAKSGFREELNISNEDRRVIYNAFASSNKFTGYSL